LILDETPLADKQLSSLAKLPVLEVLYLRRTGVTDAGLGELLGLKPSLRSLALSGPKITDAASMLLQLENLDYLDLAGSGVTDDTLDQLSGLKKLRMIKVDDTTVSEPGLARLRQALPQLRNANDVLAASRARAASKNLPKKTGSQP
jgi:Leucine-rich repeat (LRR) protein